MTPMVNEDALESLFDVEATERAAYRIADRGTDRLEQEVQKRTPIDESPYRFAPGRPRGTARRSIQRRKTGGSAPTGFVPHGLVHRPHGTSMAWVGKVSSDDEVAARYLEEDTPPHTIKPKTPGGWLRFQSRRGFIGKDGKSYPPGTWVSVKEVKHPGTKGAHMHARGALATEVHITDIARAALGVWAQEVTR